MPFVMKTLFFYITMKKTLRLQSESMDKTEATEEEYQHA